MSGAQMAHFLKQVVKGSELAGIGAVFRVGWIVGVGQTLLVQMHMEPIGLESGATKRYRNLLRQTVTLQLAEMSFEGENICRDTNRCQA